MPAPESIFFHKEDIAFRFSQQTLTKKWLKKIASKEGYSILCLNYIFCSDSYLLEMNQEYLNHNTLTDIITFDNSEEKGKIEGDIYISIDRIQENAQKFGVSFPEELRRVLAHGLLHLTGYKDKSVSDKEIMRKKENASLSLFSKLKAKE